MEREKQREKERQSRQQQVSENNVKDKKELFGSPVKVISRFVINVSCLLFCIIDSIVHVCYIHINKHIILCSVICFGRGVD